MNEANEQAPLAFTIMCVLVLVGNLFLIVVNLLKEAMLATGIQQGNVGDGASFYLSLLLHGVLLSCVGAMAGALLMLLGKRLGFTIYAVSIGLHLVLTVVAMLLWAMTIFLVGFSGLLLVYSVIPVAFFVYFSTHRGHLR